MSKDRSLVRASDIGAWAYCNRAWWLVHVQHAQHERPERLARGDAAHRAHGRSVLQADRLQRWGRSLILAGLLLGLLLLLARLLT
ncbi:MAG: hypothetical protein D6790_17800 [Caldilineae bacterium]|nr:MAG: hypothetical protein D6790_17800 [Caldilineae bacterium]